MKSPATAAAEIDKYGHILPPADDPNDKPLHIKSKAAYELENRMYFRPKDLKPFEDKEAVAKMVGEPIETPALTDSTTVVAEEQEAQTEPNATEAVASATVIADATTPTPTE